MRHNCPPPGPATDVCPTHESPIPTGARICSMVDGPLLCAVRMWTEAEWAALPDAAKPALREHLPGRGWVGAIPVAVLN